MPNPPALYRHPLPSPLLSGRLVRRYKRFLADIDLDSGERITAHCVNTGRMEGLPIPGNRVWISRASNPDRKLKFTWELVESGGVIVGANTSNPNKLMRGLLDLRVVRGLSRWTELRPEPRLESGKRADFSLRVPGGMHFVEVKNCHLVYPDGVAYFPDTVSERAKHHMQELAGLVSAGHRASVYFMVQRPDVRVVKPSDAHDPEFAAAAREAHRLGVKFRAFRVRPTVEALHVESPVRVDMKPYSTKRPAKWRAENRARMKEINEQIRNM